MLRPGCWIVGINPVGDIAGVLDILLISDLGDHFNHFHNERCMKTTLQW
jgi:hypothetical protein